MRRGFIYTAIAAFGFWVATAVFKRRPIVLDQVEQLRKVGF